MISTEKVKDQKSGEVLISKKELLSLTKISYGQLYRWKRMNIIPENWFIKKSSPTGQETFFKRDKILERIEMILSMKDNVSLDEIAALVNKKEEEKAYEINDIAEKGIVSKAAVDVFISLSKGQQILGKKEIIILSIIEKYLLNSQITLEELKLILEIMEEAVTKLYCEEGRLILYRKFGVPFVAGYRNNETFLMDSHAVKIMEIDLIGEFGEMSRKLVK